MDGARVQRGRNAGDTGYVTVFHNGVLVQNHFSWSARPDIYRKTVTRKIRPPPSSCSPIHDPSATISFRTFGSRDLNNTGTVNLTGSGWHWGSEASS